MTETSAQITRDSRMSPDSFLDPAELAAALREVIRCHRAGYGMDNAVKEAEEALDS